MKILITNDDGIGSSGIRALAEFLGKQAECWVAAPHQERSATGHSISLRGEIWVEKVALNGGMAGYSIDGTPADCVKFALHELKHEKIDLIISGINLGLNSGVSVYYSGTVSAAREGLINGIPAIAISQGKEQTTDFAYSLQLVEELVQAYREAVIPRDVFLNVNVPPVPSAHVKGVRITKQAHSKFAEWFEAVERPGSNGKRPYAVRGEIEILRPDGTSDEEALQSGFASITPLHLDSTHYETMGILDRWAEGAFRRKGKKA